MKKVLKLIRWKNLLLIVLTQVLIKYALLEPLKDGYGLETTLTNLGFMTLVLATVLIATAGYIINDIEDVEADKINKPKSVIIENGISEKSATILFITFNLTGVVLGFLISKSVSIPSFFVLFIICSALLYLYSTYLKRIALIGNLVIAALVGFSILIVGIFDLIPVINDANRSTQLFFLELILDYAIFAFMLNLLRELVKDLEDIDGDYKIGVKSLPIILGRSRAKHIVFILSHIPLIVIIFYLINNLYKQPLAVAYTLIFIIAPMIYTAIKLFSAEQKKDYKHISTLLKLVMLTGVLSLVLFQFILLNSFKLF